ncbi:hypothetical protein ACFX13_041130 [Malus domestica]
MAQPGQKSVHSQIQMPIHPQMPPAPLVPILASEPAHSSTLKRRREDEFAAVLSGQEPQEPGPKRRTKAQDVVFRIVAPSRQIGKRHEERVIIISSKDSDNSSRDAEKALQQMAGLILKEDDSGTEAAKVGAGHVAANTIRLLIAGSQAGIGNFPAVLKALQEISDQLRDNPPWQVISISPAYNYPTRRPPQVQPYMDPTSAEYITFEMVISETLVGGLIGRNGSNISRIRNASGAMVKVYGGKGEQKHRQVQFCGSAHQVYPSFTF